MGLIGVAMGAGRLFRKVIGKLDFQSRREMEKFKKRRALYYRHYWEKAAEACKAEIEDIGHGFYKIKKGGRWTIVRGFETQLDDHLSLNMAGNKPLIHRILKENGIPVPEHLEYTLSSISKAVEFLGASGKVVVKPAGGGAGNGITTNIINSKQLKRASLLASLFHKNLLIEKHITGNSYRLTYLNGRFMDAVRRDPPSVMGDNKHSIKQLIVRENEKRLRGSSFTGLSPITIDLELRKKLEEQRLGLKEVPKKGVRTVLKDVINQNASCDNHRILKENINPTILKQGENIAELFRLQLVGVDIITENIGVPLEQNEGVVNEINTTPGLHHHDLVSDQTTKAPLGKVILEYLLSRQ